MMSRVLHGASLALWSICISGCVLEPVPFEDLRCPCAAPLVCDEARNTCVDTLIAPCGRMGAEPSEIEVLRFERWWVTATQARMRWETSSPSTVSSLAIDLAESADALEAGTFETIDGVTNPELARGFLPGTSGVDAVESTILRTLEDDHAYVARLVIYDETGGVSCSAPLPFRTNLAPHESLPLFEESLLPGASPRVACSEIVEDAADAATGTTFLAHTFRCQSMGVGQSESVCTEPEPAASTCWENVGFWGASLDLTGLSSGAFSTAYIEVSAAVDDENSAFWAEFAVTTGDDTFYQASEITIIADGAYHRYEIPLSQLTRQCFDEPACVWDTPIEREALTTLTGFRLGMGLSNGARMRLDDIRLRW